jgi:hypothetical protein
MVSVGIVEVGLAVGAVAMLASAGGRRVLAKLALVALVVAPVMAIIFAERAGHRRDVAPIFIPNGEVRHDPFGGVSIHAPDKRIELAPMPPVPPVVPKLPIAQASLPTAAAGPVQGSGEPAVWLKVAVLLLPVVVLLAAFAAVRGGPSAGAERHRGSGLGWLVAGVAVLVLLGFVGLTRVEVSPRSVQPSPQPMAVVQLDGNVGDIPPSVDREAIEEQWERLTGPRIDLDLPSAAPSADAVAESAAQSELTSAAKTLKAAAEQMSEAASEGWLLTATRALVNVSAKKPAAAKPAAQAASAAASVKAAGAGEALEGVSASAATSQAKTSAKSRSKPDWVTNPAGLVGETRHVVVSVGPYQSLDECYLALEEKMCEVALGRVRELASVESGSTVNVANLQQIRVGTDYVLRELCIGEYDEVVHASFGPMRKAYALMAFTQPQDKWLLDRWKDFARRDRLTVLAILSGLTVGGVAFVYGLLKVDTWTRGYYSKRLFIGVPAAIIGVVTLIAMLG